MCTRVSGSWHMQTLSEAVLIYRLSVEKCEDVNLLRWEQQQKGYKHAYPIRDRQGTLKLKECQHCSKDPMRDIWQFIFSIFWSKINFTCMFLPVDTAINYSPQVSRHMWIRCNQKSILVLKLTNFLSPCILENRHVLVWPANQEITEFGWKFSCKPSRSVWYLFGITKQFKRPILFCNWQIFGAGAYFGIASLFLTRAVTDVV